MKISASLARLMLAALFGFGLFPTAYSATRVIDLTRYGVRPDKKSSVTATLNSAIAKLSAECAERDTLVLRLHIQSRSGQPKKRRNRNREPHQPDH